MRRALFLLVPAYVLVLLWRAATTRPYIDEAWYILPAWNLITNGSFGTPVLEPSSSPIPVWAISLHGVREHTYWLMPVFPLAAAVWMLTFGFGIFNARVLVILGGGVLLIAWFLIVHRLSGGSRRLAALAVAVIAIDPTFMYRATMARPDMFAAVFGYSAIAAYLLLREKWMPLAAFVSNALLALAGLTHPNGGMVCLVGLVTIALMLDRQAMHVRLLPFAVIPYGIAAAAFGLYIAQDPVAFHHQFFGNSSGRLTAVLSPLSSLQKELLRYVSYYGFSSESRFAVLRVFPVLLYGAAFLFVAITFKRRGTACQRLFPITCAAVLALTLVENYKVGWYLIYTIPALAALTAAAYDDIRRSLPRFTAPGVAAVLLLLSIGNTVRLAVRDRKEDLYDQTIAFIINNAPPNALIMGSSELFFGLGADRLIDDISLGYYSGVQPQVIVMGPPQDRRAVRDYPHVKPDVQRHVKNYLERDFHMAFSNPLYSVYVPPGPRGTNSGTTRPR